MIGMAVAALGAPRDEGLRMKLFDKLVHIVGDGVNILRQGIGNGAQFAVIQIKKDRRLDSELLAGASGFGPTRGGERFTGGNFGEVGGSFLALRGDGEVNADALASVPRQRRSCENFVIGMRKHSKEDARLRPNLLRLKHKGE